MNEMCYERYEGYKMADCAKQLAEYISLHSSIFNTCGWDYERAKALYKELNELNLYLSAH